MIFSTTRSKHLSHGLLSLYLKTLPPQRPVNGETFSNLTITKPKLTII